MPKTAWEKADPHQSPAVDGAERGSAQEETPDHVWGAPQGWVPQARPVRSSVFSDSGQVPEHKGFNSTQNWVGTQCPKLSLGQFTWQDCLKPMFFMQMYKIAVVYPLLLGLLLKADTNRM